MKEYSRQLMELRDVAERSSALPFFRMETFTDVEIFQSDKDRNGKYFTLGMSPPNDTGDTLYSFIQWAGAVTIKTRHSHNVEVLKKVIKEYKYKN